MVDPPPPPPPPPDKVPGTKSIFQEIVTKKLSTGEIEILFQMEIDSEGKTTFTVFRSSSLPVGERKKPNS